MSDTGRTRNRAALTDKLVRELLPKAGSYIQYDDRVSGFGIRVTPAGAKAFVLNYVADGRERRSTIGRYPAWGVAAARDEAAKLRRRVDAGGDPQGEKNARRKMSTLNDHWGRYRDEVSARKAATTHRDEKSSWERFILPSLGSRRVEDITSADVDKLHNQIAAKTPIQANRVIASLRHALNVAVRWGVIATNPVNGIKLASEEARERYLSLDELKSFIAACRARLGDASADAFLFILFTGCRKSEALKATWDQFDLKTGIWVKPSAHTKQRKLHRVPLNDAALSILRSRPAGEAQDFVFAGRDGRQLVSPKRMFASICKEAGITNFRIHDMRHTFASFLASGGASYAALGQLLGHTQANTTKRYAHLFDEPLREATNIIGNLATRGLFSGEETAKGSS